MIVSRDTRVRRLLRRADLTQAEANAVAATLDGAESFLDDPDWFLDSQALAHGGVTVAAGGALNRSIIQLRNRSLVATSPSILIVQEVVTWVAINITIDLGYNSATLGAGSSSSGNYVYRDLQWLEPGRVGAAILVAVPAGVIEFNNTIPYGAQGSGAFAQFNGPGATMYPFKLGGRHPVAVLSPGYALQVFPDTDNALIQAYFVGRELYLRHR